MTIESVIQECLDAGYMCGSGARTARRDEVLRRSDAVRLLVIDEIRAAGNLDAYEVQVRSRMSKGGDRG